MSGGSSIPLSDRLDLSPSAIDAYLRDTLEHPEFVAAVARSLESADLTATTVLLGNIASEARLACRMLESLAPARAQRVLEVGAGSCAFATFLHGQGANVVALEPIIRGFEPFVAVREVLARWRPLPSLALTTADALDPLVHGKFDVIMSVNVLEHMQPLGRNLDAMADVLETTGTMIHTCPNYRVPYEPHCGVPLVPGRPGMTRHIARRAGRSSVWPTLNWITPRDISSFAARRGLVAEFRGGQLEAALGRLRDDPEFARRQRGPVVSALKLVERAGLGRVLARIPPRWMTPMTFTVRHRR